MKFHPILLTLLLSLAVHAGQAPGYTFPSSGGGSSTWAELDKTGSSLGDIETRDASHLSSGTLPDARLSANVPVMTAGVLPAASAANLTNIPAANLTGALPAISGANLTNLPASSQSLSTQVELWEEFLRGTMSTTVPTGPLRLIDASSGGAVSDGTTPDATAVGVLNASTGSGATNAACFITGAASFRFGGGEVTSEHRLYINASALSDGTDTYRVYAGFNDNSGTDGTDGVYFRYTHGENSGNWTAVCRSNSVETTLDTGTAVALNTWYRLRCVINANASSVEFFINGVSKGTITTNIPSGSGRETALYGNIRKTAGTSSRTMQWDYVYFKFVPTAPR